MIYLKSIAAGIAASALSLIILALIVGVIYRREQGMVGINVLRPFPLMVAALGFLAGFYFVFRRS